MRIGKAIKWLRRGYCVRREGWNGRTQYLTIVEHEHEGEDCDDYILIVPERGSSMPWTASQTDLLADDWILA